MTVLFLGKNIVKLKLNLKIKTINYLLMNLIFDLASIQHCFEKRWLADFRFQLPQKDRIGKCRSNILSRINDETKHTALIVGFY